MTEHELLVAEKATHSRFTIDDVKPGTHRVAYMIMPVLSMQKNATTGMEC